MRSKSRTLPNSTSLLQANPVVVAVLIGLSNATAVATLYVPQVVGPLLFQDALARQDWLPITATFLGYCGGNAVTAFNLVPLISESTRNHLGLLAVALLLTATAPTMPIFAATCFLTGVGASVAQRLLVMAAQRAGPDRAGNAVAGCVATALLAVLGLRVWGEQIASALGWRTMFAIMSVPFIGWFLVGKAALRSTISGLMKDSPIDIIRLVRSSTLLRRCMGQQAMVFATYNAAWVLLAAQLAPSERASVSFWGSLAGVTSLVMVGIFINRERTRFFYRLANTAMLVPGCPLLLFAYAGVADTGGLPHLGLLLAFPLGMAFIDAGMQLTLVANQTRVQEIVPASKARLASLLTISGSLGGAMAGGASRWLWQCYGWQTALTLVALTAAGGLLVACAPTSTSQFIPEH